MRKRLLFPAMSIALLAGILVLVSEVPGDKKYSPRESNRSEKRDANGYIQWLLSKRADPATGTVDLGLVEAARQQANAMSGSRALNLAWQELGPNNVGGRTRAFLIDRNNNNRLYAGGVGGGLWYSENAGASWNKINGGDNLESISVASICQGTDGYIYFGTGEGLYGNFGDGTGGLAGQGIFKSTSPTTPSSPALNFARLPFTWQTTEQATYRHVNKMAASPSNPLRIYAATTRGLRVTDDGGDNWYNPLGSTVSTGRDVDVASDGTVLASVNNRGYRSASGDNGTYTLLAGGLPTNSSRTEFAIAPSDPNIMYASTASSTGALLNIYMSTNKGDNWTIIGPGGAPTVFNPFRNQGTYDNALGVTPNNPYKIILGGVELWQWVGNSSFVGQWTEIDCWGCWDQSVYYTHADKHNIAFDPINPNIMYVISDGGIAKSLNQGSTYTRKNKNYNTVQFYSVGVDPNGNPMGGTQDNGTQYITGRTIVNPNDDPQFAWEVMGGDGGYTEFSYLYPPTTSPFLGIQVGAVFGGTPNAEIRRSNGGSFSRFYDNHIDFGTDPDNPTYNGDFVTPFRLWESNNDLLAADQVTFRLSDSLSQTMESLIPAGVTRANGTLNYTYTFQNSAMLVPGSIHITDGVQHVYDNGSGAFTGDVNTSQTNTIDYNARTFDVTFNATLAVDSALMVYYKIQYDASDVVNINSATANLPISYTLTSPLLCGDSVTIQDVIQARFVAGLTAPNGNCVWLTKRALDFSTSTPPWIKIASGLAGTPSCFVFSKDGNHLFVGTQSGRVYRISGLSQVKDSLTGWVGSSGYVLTVTTTVSSLASGSVTGMDISETNPNKLFVTTGCYNANPHVYRSLNALSTFTFTQVHNTATLPSMPCYDVVVNNVDDNKIILGTDLGIWASDDNGATWSEENQGTARTAVVMLRQYNSFTGGAIYAASHGRGIFKSTTLVGINDPHSTAMGSIDQNTVRVFPNPMTDVGFADFILNESSTVDVEIYDIKGTLLKTDKLGKRASGLHRHSFDAAALRNGTYFIVIRAGSQKATGRFVIVK